MRTIYKYPLQIADEQTIPLAYGAKILCVQSQNDRLCIWVDCESTNSPASRTIEIFGTGHPMSQQFNRCYIGTVQQGAFVWHVYERNNA